MNRVCGEREGGREGWREGKEGKRNVKKKNKKPTTTRRLESTERYRYERGHGRSSVSCQCTVAIVWARRFKRLPGGFQLSFLPLSRTS